jgi:hypothetical protein
MRLYNAEKEQNFSKGGGKDEYVSKGNAQANILSRHEWQLLAGKVVMFSPALFGLDLVMEYGIPMQSFVLLHRFHFWYEKDIFELMNGFVISIVYRVETRGRA